MWWEYKAKVVKVLDFDSLDLNIDLGFKVFKRQVVKLRGLEVVEEDRPKAKSCLILLVGGHRIVLRTYKEGKTIFADVYAGGPPPYPGVSEVVGGSRLFSVNKVMERLKLCGFDPEELKRRLNGHQKLGVKVGRQELTA